MRADIASTGGNYRLNIGPRADGTLPPESIERLEAIGAWMKMNGEAIHGTTASPFAALPFGRCTQKPIAGGTRLYFHIFEWPSAGRILLPGLTNKVRKAFLLAGPGHTLTVQPTDEGIAVALPASTPDTMNAVLAVDITGPPAIVTAPHILATSEIFGDTLHVSFARQPAGIVGRYTLDGTAPNATSARATRPMVIATTTTINARNFRKSGPVGLGSSRTFRKVEPSAAVAVNAPVPGLRYALYEGRWNVLPDFRTLTPAKEGLSADVTLQRPAGAEWYGIRFDGLLRVDATGVYAFTLASDDGSRLTIDGQTVVDHDGTHSLSERSGVIPLAAGYHRITIGFFQGEGGDGLVLTWARAGATPVPIPADRLFHE
jgi:alpha-L-fucosidase